MNRKVVIPIVLLAFLLVSPFAAASVSVDTLEPEDVTDSSAVFYGEVYSESKEDAEVWFEWRPRNETDWMETRGRTKELPREETKEFSRTVQGLEMNTAYEYRMMVDYNDTVVEGDIVSFTTTNITHEALVVLIGVAMTILFLILGFVTSWEFKIPAALGFFWIGTLFIDQTTIPRTVEPQNWLFLLFSGIGLYLILAGINDFFMRR